MHCVTGSSTERLKLLVIGGCGKLLGAVFSTVFSVAGGVSVSIATPQLAAMD
jgi:hypothetical protein